MFNEPLRYEGRLYKVIEILEEYLLVIPVNGIMPANPLVIPKPEED